MPEYLKEALHKFQHPNPPRPQNAPHAWKAPTYGVKIHGDGVFILEGLDQVFPGMGGIMRVRRLRVLELV